MVWDGIQRRKTDSGTETTEMVLARIDERTKNLDFKINTHITHFDLHVEDDKKNFAGLYKIAYVGIGIMVVIKVFLSH